MCTAQMLLHIELGNHYYQSKKSLLDCKGTERIVHVSLPLSLSLLTSLVLVEGFAHCSGLLAAEIQWLVFPLVVKFPQVFPLVMTDYCQQSGY